MAKHLMFYENAVPVSASRHRDASLESGTGYAFASHATAAPIVAAEFLSAAAEYAIVFAPVGDEVLPAVVLGLRNEQNLYMGAEAQWTAKYVPAFMRRYPFVFSASPDQKTLTLCIDEASAGFNRLGRGERLFDDDGKPSAYTQRVVKFLQQFQAHFQRTREFCNRVKELGVLTPTAVRIGVPGADRLAVGGFQVVDRKKLRALSDDKLAGLAKTDELELLYLHLYSLRNFSEMKDRLIGALPTEGEEQPSPPAMH
jgi:hypothetical protein